MVQKWRLLGNTLGDASQKCAGPLRRPIWSVSPAVSGRFPTDFRPDSTDFRPDPRALFFDCEGGPPEQTPGFACFFVTSHRTGARPLRRIQAINCSAFWSAVA